MATTNELTFRLAFVDWDNNAEADALVDRIVNASDAHQRDKSVPSKTHGYPVAIEYQCRHCHRWYIEGTLISCSAR